MESPGRYGDWLAPPPSPPRGSRSQSIRPARGKDFYLATSGDLYLATSRDIFMATDTHRGTPRPEPVGGSAALLMLLLQDEEARARVWHATAPSNPAHNYGTYGVDPLWTLLANSRVVWADGLLWA